MKKNRSLSRMVVSALLLALGMVLPFLTGQIQVIGRIISPLHIPALICGLTCGWQWGLALGVVLPLLRGLTLGMPPFPVVALPMAFELGGYGLLTGLLYPFLLKKLKGNSHLPAMLCALVLAMIGGRIIGGAGKALLLTLGLIGSSSPYTFAVFFSSYFVSTAPGALIHLVLVPAVVTALERAKLSPLVAK
ncbi:MAG: ECF transporter S component [Clostridia bacterium]|nr:ECF transporter S component [Clostridia bacterium]